MNEAPIIIEKSSADFLQKYVDFYRICFPSATHLNSSYLKWLYKANPNGEIIGADAYSEGQLIGQVAAIPSEYHLNGRLVKGLLAVNVAVHPKFQGRRLFKKLGLKMCEYGAEDGYEFVIGIANAAATPGWTRQMGFQLVQPLEARLGVGKLDIDLGVVARSEQFKKAWADKSLAWRKANPNNSIWARRSEDRLEYFASAKGKVLPVYAELPVDGQSNLTTNTSAFCSPLRLFLGLVPNNACKYRTYVNVPQRLRPSPLNFIYRSLTNRVEKLEKNCTSFSFLDFDAY